MHRSQVCVCVKTRLYSNFIAISGKIRHIFDILQINPQLLTLCRYKKIREKNQPPATIHGTFSDGSGSSTSIPPSARASRMTWSFWASMTGKEIVSFEWVENWRIQKPFIDIHRSLSVWKICTCIYICVCVWLRLYIYIYVYLWYCTYVHHWNETSIQCIISQIQAVKYGEITLVRFDSSHLYTGMNYEHVGDGSKLGTTLPSPKSESQSVLSFQDRK